MSTGWRPQVPGIELGEVVGRGGFSTVYLGFQPSLNRPVAVKVINPSIQADPDAQRRFERECRAIGSLTGHPSVVTVYASGTTAEGDPYLVMEFLEGGSLHDRMARDGRLPWPEVVQVGVQVAEALDAAHGIGLLHRDVKPANVLHDRFGRHKLGDFGIAGLAAGGQTTVGTSAATLAFASPEVLLGSRASERSDLYGLGALLYALLVGAPAHVGATDESLAPMLMRIVQQDAAPLPPELAPAELAELLRELLARTPEDRPVDAGSVVARLRVIEAGHLVGATQLRPAVPVVPVVPAVPAAVSSRVADRPTVEDAATDLHAGLGRIATAPDVGHTPELDDDLGHTVRRPRGAVTGPTPVLAPVAEPAPSGPVVVEPVVVEPVVVEPVVGKPGDGGPGGVPFASRLRAAAIDLVVAAVVLLIVLAASATGPATDPHLRVRYEGDGVVAVSTQVIESTTRPVQLELVSEAGDLRLGLRQDGREVQPPGGAVVQEGSPRSLTLPRLDAGTVEVVRVAADGRVVDAWFAGGQRIEVVEDPVPSFLVLTVQAVVLGALVLLLGWPALIAVAVVVGGFSVPGAVAAVALLVVVDLGIRAWRGASVGEAVAGLSIRHDGRRADWRRQVLRWLARPLSTFPLGAGYWVPRRAGEGRPWHDRLAGTEVVEQAEGRAPRHGSSTPAS